MRNPTDERILRDVMIRELETIQEYDRMIEQAENADVRRFLAHAVYEEKEHVAEAMQLLGQLDPMQREAIEEDHSAHFRAGGPGDVALQRILGNSTTEASPSPSSAVPDAAVVPETAGSPVVRVDGVGDDPDPGARARQPIVEPPPRATVGNPRAAESAVASASPAKSEAPVMNGRAEAPRPGDALNADAVDTDAVHTGAVDTDAVSPAVPGAGVAPSDADANPFPWVMAPNARLSEVTVGTIRGADR